jgi:hypothetical protein
MTGDEDAPEERTGRAQPGGGLRRGFRKRR